MITIMERDLDVVHDNATYAVGSRTELQGKEYIFLKGLASTAVGSWVTYDEVGVTALLAANAKGMVAIAMAASVADKYGWYQIFGSAEGKLALNCGADAALYSTSTAGTVDDAVVAGDRIKGAYSRDAVTTAAVATVQLMYPYVDDMAD